LLRIRPSLTEAYHLRLGMVVYACNPSTQEDCEFQARLSYITRPYFKKEKTKKKHIIKEK
jgi:hypothetical protein